MFCQKIETHFFQIRPAYMPTERTVATLVLYLSASVRGFIRIGAGFGIPNEGRRCLKVVLQFFVKN